MSRAPRVPETCETVGDRPERDGGQHLPVHLLECLQTIRSAAYAANGWINQRCGNTIPASVFTVPGPRPIPDRSHARSSCFSATRT